MGKAKLLGDHSQTRFEIIRNASINVALALVLPFVAVFTTSVGLKNGVKTKQPLRYSLHGFAFLVSLTSMLFMPAVLYNFFDGSDSAGVVDVRDNVSVVLSPDYIGEGYAEVETSVANFGEHEGVIDVSLDNVLQSINKNISISKTFYEDKDFKMTLTKSDGSVNVSYIYMKSDPNILVVNDLISKKQSVVDKASVDLYGEEILKQAFSKASVTTTVNEKDSSINDVLLAVQGEHFSYASMYATGEEVNFAMQKLDKIIVNSTGDIITVYQFTGLDDSDLKMFSEVLALNENSAK